MDLFGEEAPSGRDWHADLIQGASRIIPARPAILPESVAHAANETGRFQHVAMRNYCGLAAVLARSAVQAARLLADELPGAVAMPRRSMDPE